MARFRVTVEDVSFTGNPELDGTELSGEDIARLTPALQHLFNAEIVGVLGAHLAEDDHQSGDDRKIFVSIDLEVEAADVDEAEAIETPDTLLQLIAAELDDGVDAAREGHWEVLSGEAVT